MKQIIAIGGGGFSSEGCNLKIEKYILAQAAKEGVKICLLPQAGNESPEYIQKFHETFTILGAEPSWISLSANVNPSWEQKILSQDIIYVGGGSYKNLLSIWKKWGMEKVLIAAYNKGIILSGISSGANCWFERGVTYSVAPVGMLEGLGLIKGCCCPHFDSEFKMQKYFRDTIASGLIEFGYALDDETAVHFIDGKLIKAIKSKEDKKIIKFDHGVESIVESTFL